jgi:MFS family permease
MFYSLVLRNPTQAAIYHFTIKTFRRNMKQKLQLALWMTIPVGLVITTTIFGYLGNKFKIIDSYLISPPVVLYIFLIPILKMVTRNPVEFEANWIFRMTEKKDKKHYLAGLKKALFFYAVFPLFIMLFLFYCFAWGFEPAIYHSFFGITIAWILMEAFFINYRNIPFTSKCLPYKANFIYSLMFYGFVFIVYNTLFTALGLFLIKNPVYYYFFYIAAFTILIALKWYGQKTNNDFKFVYDEETDPIFLSLDLDK